MQHSMKLDPAPFAMMRSGRKKIELRLYDEKRRKIKTGDEILFTENGGGAQLRARVVGIDVFPDFAELYAALPLLECGYTEQTVLSASPKDMDEYYSPAEQAKYGAVGIRIELLPPVKLRS